MACLQCCLGWTTVPLTASTPRTVAAIKAPANQAVKILEIMCTHDRATSTNAPDVTDVARCTFATAGTSTVLTQAQMNAGKKDPGRAENVQTAGYLAFTVEPTVITPLWSFNLAQFNGLYHYILPMANPLIIPGGQGFLIRQTAPNGVK